MSTKLYTIADLVEFLGSTKQKVHDWSQRAGELFVEPDYHAGRVNQNGKCLISLWTEGQLEEIEENFSFFEARKAEWHKARKYKKEPSADYEKKRAEDMRRYRANYRKKKAEQAKADLDAFAEKLEVKKLEAEKPKPAPIKVPDFTPPSAEAISYEEKFHQEMEDKAMQFLIEKGLV